MYLPAMYTPTYIVLTQHAIWQRRIQTTSRCTMSTITVSELLQGAPAGSCAFAGVHALSSTPFCIQCTHPFRQDIIWSVFMRLGVETRQQRAFRTCSAIGRRPVTAPLRSSAGLCAWQQGEVLVQIHSAAGAASDAAQGEPERADA